MHLRPELLPIILKSQLKTKIGPKRPKIYLIRVHSEFKTFVMIFIAKQCKIVSSRR